MDTSRRRALTLFGLGSAALVSGTAADALTLQENLALQANGTLQQNAKALNAATHERRQNALAFVNSVNSDLVRYGLPPLDAGYVARALGQA